jgi:hypothetical protein
MTSFGGMGLSTGVKAIPANSATKQPRILTLSLDELAQDTQPLHNAYAWIHWIEQ